MRKASLEQLALLLLVRNARINAPELALTLNVSENTARSVCTRLKRLKLAKLVDVQQVHRGPPRSVYALTDKGRAALAIPLDTKIDEAPRIAPRTPRVRPAARGGGSGVIAGRKEIRGYLW